MKPISLKKSITQKILLLVLPILFLVGFSAPSAQARDDHRGRGAQHAFRGGGGRHNYARGGYGGRGYRGGYYAEHRHHGYWRNYHGRRYWYDDGTYYDGPGGMIINIGL